MHLSQTRLLLSSFLWSVGILGMGGAVGPNSTAVVPPPTDSGVRPASPPRRQFKTLQLGPGRGHPQNLDLDVDHAYFFDLQAGEFLRLVFDQRDVDITVDILDPLHHRILGVDTINGSRGPEDVPFVAESPGAYEVRISSKLAGRYIPRIATRRLATPQDRILATAVLAYSQGKDARNNGGTWQEIKDEFSNAARLLGEVGETVHRADAYYQLGILYCDATRWAYCLDAYERALALYEENDNLSQAATVLAKASDAMAKLGKYDQSLEGLRRSVSLAKKVRNKKTEATASLMLGILQLSKGEVEPALKNFGRSLELSQSISDPSKEVNALTAMGWAYASLGDIEKALSFYREARKKIPSGSIDLLIQTLVSIGDAYFEANTFQYSKVYYLQALSLIRKDRGVEQANIELEAAALNGLGRGYYHERRYQEALDSLLQARQIYQQREEPAEEAICWGNIGRVLTSMSRVPQAMEAFETALAVNRKLRNRPAESAAYFGMALAERSRNNLIAARGYAQQAVEVVESIRGEAVQPELRRAMFASRANFYDLLIDIMMEQHGIQPGQGHDVEGFETSERARARSLLDSLGERSAPPLLSLADIQQKVVDKDTILLEYQLGDDRSFLWAVTPDSCASFELPGRSRIEPLAREVYGLLKRTDKREIILEATRKARDLSKVLLGPVASRLGDKRLLIVTPAVLQSLPFAALPDLTVSEPEIAAWAWPYSLMERHEIVSVPSASVIGALRMRKGEKISKHLLALVGNPASSDPSRRLENSRDEVDQISRIAGDGNFTKFLNFDANRGRILGGALDGYKYIHFSVHGEPNSTRPDLSSLILSDIDSRGNPRESRLRAMDIQGLKLSADLVVLAACSSGLGQEVPGEGLVGLTQAFFSSGASGVMVGLWDVNDLATASLMPHFYTNLLKKGLSPAAALRETQRWMRRDKRWNAPYYWGGFVQQGEWE